MAERLARIGVKKTLPEMQNQREEVKLVESENFDKNASESDKTSPNHNRDINTMTESPMVISPPVKEFGSGQKVFQRQKSRFSTYALGSNYKFDKFDEEKDLGVLLRLNNMNTIVTVKSINEETKMD